MIKIPPTSNTIIFNSCSDKILIQFLQAIHVATFTKNALKLFYVYTASVLVDLEAQHV